MNKSGNPISEGRSPLGDLGVYLFPLCTWCLLVLCYGYRFGTGDHGEYLPYVLYLHDHSLYAHDFFMQGLIQKFPNERTVVAYMLLPFVNHLEVACFVLQLLFTVLLIIGLEKLGTLLVGNVHVARIAILINFLLFFNRGLGDVELYSDVLQGSSMSVAIIAVGLYFFFREEYIIATVLLSIASIIHPVEGLAVYLVMIGAIFIYMAVFKEVNFRTFIRCVLIYALTAGIFIAIFFAGKVDGLNTIWGQFDKETFFRIYFVFRHSHHYIFHYFPLADKILFAVFMLINLAWGYVYNKKFLWFNLIALFGLVIYVIATDYLHQVDIAGLQFYKITQWIKFLAILIAVNYLWNLPAMSWLNRLANKASVIIYGILLPVLILVVIVKPAIFERPGIYHQYGSGWKEKNDMVMLSMKIDSEISKQAVFIQPFGCTELKYFGKASSYVDWKAFLKNRNSVFEWYRRIGMVYGISINDPEKGFDLEKKADDYYNNLTAEKAALLKREGVTHIISTNKNWPNGALLFQNKTYAVYQL